MAASIATSAAVGARADPVPRRSARKQSVSLPCNGSSSSRGVSAFRLGGGVAGRRGQQMACAAVDLRKVIERLCLAEDLSEQETEEALDVRAPTHTHNPPSPPSTPTVLNLAPDTHKKQNSIDDSSTLTQRPP